MLTAILSQVSYLPVLLAAVAGWLFGSLYYAALGGPWAAAHGWDKASMSRPPVSTMIISFLCEIVMATMLFGVIFHIGEINVERALFSAAMLWIGFVATTVIVNYRFGRHPWSLVLIDAGHWLGVLLVMGLVLGLFGA